MEKGEKEIKEIKSKQTYEYKKKELKNGNNRITVSIGISDMPVSVFKEFTSGMNKYNDIYWVKILDLMRKAEAYDLMVQGGSLEYMDVEEDVTKIEKEEAKPEVVKTLGGDVKVGGKGK